MLYFKGKFNSQLLKITSLNSVSVLVRVTTGLISSKFIAYFIGPSGMAIMGNFRNFISAIESIGIMGLNNGIIKSVAEKSDNKDLIYNLITTVFYFVLISGSILGLFVFLFSNAIGIYLFDTKNYQTAIQVLAILLPFQLLNVVLITFLNGLRAYKKVIILTIFTYFLGLLFSVYLMWKFQVLGALISISILSFAIFFISMFFLNKSVALSQLFHFKNFNIKLVYEIIPLGMMTLFSAIMIPLVYIHIRKFIIHFDSLESAGYYEAINRISSFYMMFISTLVSLYFLPELSKSKTVTETKNIMGMYYRQIIPVFIIGLLIVYFTKDYSIKLLLTKEFLPVKKLFVWQLIGDLFKALSLILGIQFYAKKMVKSYFITEIFSLVILILSSYFCIRIFKVEGAVISYSITYVIYFIVLAFFFRKKLKTSNSIK